MRRIKLAMEFHSKVAGSGPGQEGIWIHNNSTC